MIEQPNGQQQPQQPQQPVLMIFWDEATQTSRVVTDSARVKNYDFALCVLNMAKLALEDARRIFQLNALQRQQQEQAQAQGIVNNLRKLRG